MIHLWLALQRERKQRRGQVAVFLLLIVVAVIIFAMVTANIGQVSAQALTIANATDASAMYLGSQLATASNQLCKQLSEKNAKNPKAECDPGTRGREFCARTGLLGTFLAILTIAGLLIATYFTGGAASPYLAWYIAGAAAAANAAGNAIVYHSGTAAALGAIQGFGMGLGIAGGVPIPGTGLVLGPGLTIPLLAGSATYTHARADHAIREGLEQVSRGLSGQLTDQRTAEVHVAAHAQLINGLPEYERIRELTLLNALSQLVDDPNRTVGDGGTGCFFPNAYGRAVGDPFDADGDGNTTESVSCLDYWWSARINTLQTALRGATADQEELVTKFIEGPWNGRSEGTLKDRRDKARSLQHFLERSEVECDCLGSAAIPNEGPTVQLWRRLDGAGYSFPAIFQPGPSQTALRAFLEAPCDPACPNPPAGWDSIDSVHKVYDEFLQWANAIVYYPGYHAPLGFPSKEAWYKHLVAYPMWVPQLYDPASSDDFYDGLGFVRGEIDGWFMTARWGVVRDRLPVCKLAYGEHPVVTSGQRLEPPFCEHTVFDIDPETGEPSQFDTDPIYDCTWQVNTSTATGVHLPNDDFNPDFSGTFPGPICKINLARRTVLKTQVATARTQVTELPTYIRDNLATILGISSLCSEGNVSNLQITNIKAALDEIPTVLKYSFDYAYQCTGITRSCSTSDSNSTCQSGGCPTCSACTTTPPASDCDVTTGTPTTSRNCSNCSFQCGTTPGTPPTPVFCSGQTGSCSYARTDTFACPQSGSKQTQKSIVAPDLHVIQLTQAEFLGVLNQFDDTLDRRIDPKGNLDNDRHIFGTTDADLDNEFAEGVGGEVFVNHAEPLGGNGEGRAALGYFLQQVESFVSQFQALQAARPVQPAANGVLPNPTQQLFDPISGTVHPVNGEYRWRDTNGVHTIKIEMGPFVMPKTETEKRGNWLIGKKCIVLVDYCENTPGCSYQGPDRAWVRITRQDPTGQQTGFWKWNPFSGTIKRAAHSYYDRLATGLCGVGDSDC